MQGRSEAAPGEQEPQGHRVEYRIVELEAKQPACVDCETGRCEAGTCSWTTLFVLRRTVADRWFVSTIVVKVDPTLSVRETKGRSVLRLRMRPHCRPSGRDSFLLRLG
jgi:hypothetical protein